MNDLEWKLKVEQKLGQISSDVKHIMRRLDDLPHCVGKENKSKIAFNRKLILIGFITYIPLIIMIILTGK